MSRMLTKWKTASIPALALAMVLTGCSGDDKEDADKPATTAAGSAEDLALDEPFRIVAAVEVQGDSEVAIDDYFNGIQLAVDDINEAGGVGGHPIELERVATPISAEGSVTAFRRALELDPDVIIGFAGNGVQAIATDVERSGVPVISQVADIATELGGPASSEWLFHAYPSVEGTSDAAGQYVVEDLGAERVGVMHINTPFGETVSERVVETVEGLDATIVDRVAYPSDSVDLTTEVRAVQEADAVVNVPFPATLVVQLDQFAQAQIDVPTLAPSNAAPLAVQFGLVEEALLENLYGLVACNPPGGDTPQATEFAEAYQDRFGSAPSGFSSMAYDSVHIAVTGVTAAGTTEGDALRDALATVEHTGGVCAETYQTDARNVMSHSAVAVSYADGVGQTERTFELPAATESR